MGLSRLIHLVLYAFVFCIVLIQSFWILLRGRILKLLGRDRIQAG